MTQMSLKCQYHLDTRNNVFQTNIQSFYAHKHRLIIRNICTRHLIPFFNLNDCSENRSYIYAVEIICQTILEMDFDRTFWNEWGRLTFWRFGISKYNRSSELLSNIAIRMLKKLPSIEWMDVRFGRSTFHHYQSFHYYFALSMNTQNQQFHNRHNPQIQWYAVTEDLCGINQKQLFYTFNYRTLTASKPISHFNRFQFRQIFSY